MYIYIYLFFLNVHIDDLIIEVVGLFADKVDRCWGFVIMIATRFERCELSQVHLHTATCPRIPISGVTSFGPVTAPLRIVALKGFWCLGCQERIFAQHGHYFVERHSFPVHWSPCQQLFASSLDFEAGRSQHKLRREKTPGRLAARVCEAAWMF